MKTKCAPSLNAMWCAVRLAAAEALSRRHDKAASALSMHARHVEERIEESQRERRERERERDQRGPAFVQGLAFQYGHRQCAAVGTASGRACLLPCASVRPLVGPVAALRCRLGRSFPAHSCRRVSPLSRTHTHTQRRRGAARLAREKRCGEERQEGHEAMPRGFGRRGKHSAKVEEQHGEAAVPSRMMHRTQSASSAFYGGRRAGTQEARSRPQWVEREREGERGEGQRRKGEKEETSSSPQTTSLSLSLSPGSFLPFLPHSTRRRLHFYAHPPLLLLAAARLAPLAALAPACSSCSVLLALSVSFSLARLTAVAALARCGDLHAGVEKAFSFFLPGSLALCQPAGEGASRQPCARPCCFGAKILFPLSAVLSLVCAAFGALSRHTRSSDGQCAPDHLSLARTLGCLDAAAPSTLLLSSSPYLARTPLPHCAAATSGVDRRSSNQPSVEADDDTVAVTPPQAKVSIASHT